MTRNNYKLEKSLSRKRQSENFFIFTNDGIHFTSIELFKIMKRRHRANLYLLKIRKRVRSRQIYYRKARAQIMGDKA